ncbi:MAG: SPOR domain-containing protein [Pseudomonadota bacterium]
MTNDTLRKQMGLGNAPGGVDDDDGGLPWLEPAPDPDRGTLSFKSLAIIGTIFLLVFIAFLAIFYNRIAGSGAAGGSAPGGTPTLIAAPIGDFKVTPEQAARGGVPGQSGPSDGPRFAEGSEQPALGVERLDEALRKTEGGVAVDLGSPDEPLIGYARPLEKRPSKPEVADVKDKGEETAAKVAVSAPKPAAPEPVAETPKAPAAPVKTASAGNFLLQLGAFSTRDSALNGWKQYSKTYPGSLAGLEPDLQSFENAAGKTLYRLRAAGLPTRGAADERCAALKAAKQACFVVAR